MEAVTDRKRGNNKTQPTVYIERLLERSVMPEAIDSWEREPELIAACQAQDWWSSLPMDWKAPNHDQGLKAIRLGRDVLKKIKGGAR